MVFIELDGGSPSVPPCLSPRARLKFRRSPPRRATLTVALDLLPELLERFASIENQVRKVLTDVGSRPATRRSVPAGPIKWRQTRWAGNRLPPTAANDPG